MYNLAWGKFSPGELVITPGCLRAFHDSGDRSIPYLVRHVSGDWGDLDPEDRQANEYALRHHLRLLSAYHLSKGIEIWVITAHTSVPVTSESPDTVSPSM